MGRRNDHSREEIRELAILAAVKLVTEHGFAGLTARKVATAIGYTVGSLYLVFKNLDELILHVNLRNLDALYQAVTQAGAPHPEPVPRLLAFGRAYLQFGLEHPDAWRMIFEHRMQHGAERPPWFESQVNRLFGLLEAPIQTLLPQAEQAAVVQAAHALWGGVHGICVLCLSDKLTVVKAASAQDLLENLMRHYLTGLQSEQGAKKIHPGR